MARTRTVRRLVVAGITAALVLVPAGSAFACGALLAPNGTISLTRTTTLAAYHNGVEHYITSFEYAGKTSGDVGSIIPLPGIPSKVIKGGGWTLQRLVLETNPPIFATDGVAAASFHRSRGEGAVAVHESCRRCLGLKRVKVTLVRRA